jgi:hypothetical protein
MHILTIYKVQLTMQLSAPPRDDPLHLKLVVTDCVRVIWSRSVVRNGFDDR